ncbi:MAG TPA: tetratricopeptide repeat protein, partial [Candidatus Acidoferrum sp.]
KHPADPQAHYIFAQVFWWPEPQEALRHLSEAVRLDPGSVSFRFSRAWMLQRVGQMAESLPDLNVADRLAPGNVRTMDLMGLAHLALEHPAEAEKVLRQAAAKAPNDPEVILHLGRALMALGREQEAQSYMERYRAIRPQELPGLRKRLGMIELATLTAPEQRGREIERFRREAGEHPDRPDYQLRLASLLLADGQKEEALREFRRLLGLNANGRIWEESGSLLLSSGEHALAREFLQRAAVDRPTARLALAIAVFRTEGPAAALLFLDGFPEGDVTGDVLLLKANLFEAAGRKAEAEKTLNQALSQAATRPDVVQQAIPLFLRLDRKEDGLKLLEQAIRANPQDSDLPLTRAIVLGLTGRFSAAEKTLREVELRWPEWDRAYLAHGLLLELSARGGEARQKLQTAFALGSQDPRLHCALARLAGAPKPAPECVCQSGLEQMLFSGCVHQQ